MVDESSLVLSSRDSRNDLCLAPTSQFGLFNEVCWRWEERKGVFSYVLSTCSRRSVTGIKGLLKLLNCCSIVFMLSLCHVWGSEPSERSLQTGWLMWLYCVLFEASAASAPHPSCDGTPAPALDGHTSLENQMLLFLFVLFSKCISAGWVSGASHAVHTLQY